jgi:ketosteroid isomerase-like protein
VGDIEDVMAIEEHWPVALQARDRDWLLAHTTAGFLCIEPEGVLDRDAYLDDRVHHNEKIVDGRNVAEHVEVLGDAAVVVNRAHFIVEDADRRRRELRVRGSGLYVRIDRRWRVALMHLSEYPSDAGWGDPLIDAGR